MVGKMAGKIAVIGAGAAGLMAACAAADAGAEVTVFEKNEKAGKKIYITGKGRCNFTNLCETQDFFDNVPRNPRFLYSAIYSFNQEQMVDFLEQNGCKTKEERGKRAFPESDHASDVTRALTDHLKKKNVKIRFHCDVTRILVKDGTACGVELSTGERAAFDVVIVATGGLSYPSTGSTGEGYRLAEDLGISVTDTAPSLVPFTVLETWPLTLQGLSLKNVGVTLVPKDAGTGKKKKKIYTGFGEMMFTHFGITGPLILSASSYADFKEHPSGFLLCIDLKPALSLEQLVARIHREFDAVPEKEMVHAIRPLFPERLCEVMADLSGEGNRTRKAKAFNEKQIRSFAELIKAVPVTVTGTRGFNEAIITRGGVSVKEINPSTMESKKIRNLYFAGEVIDVDALTGGFNLQIDWSTGHLAGVSAAGEEE